MKTPEYLIASGKNRSKTFFFGLAVTKFVPLAILILFFRLHWAMMPRPTASKFGGKGRYFGGQAPPTTQWGWAPGSQTSPLKHPQTI